MPVSLLAPLLEQLPDLDAAFAPLPAGQAVPKAWTSPTVLHQFEKPSSLLVPFSEIRNRADLSLQLCVQLALPVEQNKWLDPLYFNAIAPYWWVLASLGAQDDSIWLWQQHPAIRVLDQLLAAGRSFQPAVQGTEFLQVLSSRMDQIGRLVLSTDDDQKIHEDLKIVHDILLRMQDSQQQSDRVLLAREMHAVRSTHVHSAVSRVIRHCMLGKKVPPRLLSFIDNVWRKYLSVIYLRQGMESAEWERALADIDTMTWLSELASVDEVQYAIDNDVSELIARVRFSVKSIRGVDAEVAQFIDWFADLLAERVSGAPMEVDFGLEISDTASAASLSRQSITASDTDNEASVMQALRTLMPNDAVRLKTFEGWKRGRIVDVDLAHDVILISDCYGQRLSAQGRRDMAAAIISGKIELLPTGTVFNCYENQLVNLLDTVLAGARERHLAQMDEQKRTREEALMLAMAEHRIKEAAMRAEKIRVVREQAVRVEKERACTQMAQRMRSGAVVQIIDDKGRMRPAFLAMVSGASGEYVFVDRNGVRMANMPMEKVVAAMVDGHLQILESGSALDSTLTGLIKDRRQYLQEET